MMCFKFHFVRQRLISYGEANGVSHFFFSGLASLLCPHDAEHWLNTVLLENKQEIMHVLQIVKQQRMAMMVTGVSLPN